MKNNVFVRFTIKGDNLDLDSIKRLIPLNANMFLKGETYEHEIVKSFSSLPQKTNRWVYVKEFINENNLNFCLNEIANELHPFLKKIELITKKYSSLFDIVIYVNKKTSIFNACLSKQNIKFLHKLNSKVSITFIEF